MLENIDHVAIAVEDIDKALEMFASVFGAAAEHRETINDYKVEVATINVGGTAVELVAGTTPDSPVSKFVAKKGPGIHHIAFEVDDIEASLRELEADGVQLIDRAARRGTNNSLVAFIHPKSTGRVLYELVEKTKR